MKKILLSMLCLGIANAYAGCDEPIVELKVNGVVTTQTVLHLKPNDLVEFGAYGDAVEHCGYYFSSARWYNEDGLLLSSGCEFSSSKYEGILKFSNQGYFDNPDMTVIIYRSGFPQEIIRGNELTLGVTQASETLAGITKLYPNPADDIINIEIGEEDALLTGEVQIFNASGQLVLTQRVESTKTTINVAALQIGIYFAFISTEKGIIKKERFLKG